MTRMTRNARRCDCERARQLASLAPDGCLSPIERAHLLGHLEFCRACSEFAEAVADASRVVAAAPLEAFPVDLDVILAASSRRTATARRSWPRSPLRWDFLLGSATGAGVVAATTFLLLVGASDLRSGEQRLAQSGPVVVVQAVDSNRAFIAEVQALKTASHRLVLDVTSVRRPGLQLE